MKGRNTGHRLSDETIKNISIDIFAKEMTQVEIGAKYNIGLTTVKRIKKKLNLTKTALLEREITKLNKIISEQEGTISVLEDVIRLNNIALGNNRIELFQKQIV